MKTQQITCNCSAYSFPHRQGGGKCETDLFSEKMREYGYEVDVETAAYYLDITGQDIDKAEYEFYLDCE